MERVNLLRRLLILLCLLALDITELGKVLVSNLAGESLLFLEFYWTLKALLSFGACAPFRSPRDLIYLVDFARLIYESIRLTK